MDTSGSRHGRTLSVPSISTPYTPPQIPTLSLTAEAPPNNFYLSASPDHSGTHLNWGSGSICGRSANVRSRSASTSSLTSPVAGQGVNKRKVVTACQRCRTRKIKCDGNLPSCGNCLKAGVACLEVDKSGERDIPRSHVLDLENRIKFLEDIVTSRCPDIDLATAGPRVELRSLRELPPAIRIVTTDLDPTSSSNASSPQVSALSTPASFDYSPYSASGQYLTPFSPFSFSDGPGSALSSPLLSPSSPFFAGDQFLPESFEQPYLSSNRSDDEPRDHNNSDLGDDLAQDLGFIVLGMADESGKYMGASSGYEFAKTIFSECPPLDFKQSTCNGLSEGNTNEPTFRRVSSCSSTASSTEERVNSGGCSFGSSNGTATGGSVTPSGPQVEVGLFGLNGNGGNGVNKLRARWTGNTEPIKLPNKEQCCLLVSTYFQYIQPQFPFLDRNVFDSCLEAIYHTECSSCASFSSERAGSPVSSPLPTEYSMETARFQVLLVLALGINTLSAKLGQPFSNPNAYYASAMSYLQNDQVSLKGSLQGLQNGLLLAMYTLHVDGGTPGVWFLNSTLVAGCAELGLHKRTVSQKVGTMAAGIFWSVYTLDRSIGTALGRPFALDEEECDVDLPEDVVPLNALTRGYTNSLGIFGSPSGKRTNFPIGSVHFLRMTRLLSTIKTTLYRTKAPLSFELSEWQLGIHRKLNETRERAQKQLVESDIREQMHTIDTKQCNVLKHLVELKYHEAVQLLFRPSPRIPKPSSLAIETCMQSSMATIQNYFELRTLGEMSYGWLHAQSLFLSGLTMLRCFKLWWSTMHGDIDPSNRPEFETLQRNIRNCSELLDLLSTRWRVMMKAKQKFNQISGAFMSLLLSAGSRPKRTGSLGTNQPIPQIQVQSSQFLGMEPTEERIEEPLSFSANGANNLNGMAQIQRLRAKQELSYSYIPELQLTPSEPDPIPMQSQQEQQQQEQRQQEQQRHAYNIDSNAWLLNEPTPPISSGSQQQAVDNQPLVSWIDSGSVWKIQLDEQQLFEFMSSQQQAQPGLRMTQQSNVDCGLGTEADADSKMWGTGEM